MKIAPGCIVRIDYEIRIKDGEVIESSARTGPLQYVHGDGKLLPGLEKALTGVEINHELRGVLAAAEVFGSEDALPTKVIARAEFPATESLETGGIFEAHTAGGASVVLRIVAHDANTVTVRMLPAIAGKDLSYRVKVLMIEDPAAHIREVVARRPPPPPAEALHIEVEEDKGP